jgi:tetratricopeptide (TPR) repeat protein
MQGTVCVLLPEHLRERDARLHRIGISNAQQPQGTDSVTGGEAPLPDDLSRATGLLSSGRHQEARAACLQLLRSAPLRAEALLLLARIESEAGHLNIAERLLRRVLVLEPGQAASAHALGRLLVQRGRHSHALHALSRALELDAGPAEAWLDRGRLHLFLDRLPAAEADLREAIARAPNDPQALDALGVVLARVHRGDESVTCFERAIRARPDYAIAHDHLGEVHLARGRIAQAMRCFENALNHDAGLASAHDHLGLALCAQARPREALAHHERARALSPGSPVIAAHCAQALGSLGRCEEAEAGFREVLTRTPGLACASAGLATLMCARGEYQRGIELIESSAAQPEAPPDLRIVCARLLARVYRVAEAFAVLEPIAGTGVRQALTTTQVRALEFTLGDLHDLDGRYSQAFACYERGNRLKPAVFDAPALQAQAESIVTAFSAKAMAKLPRVPEGAAEVLFIVGMPRSGTSLLEQILASHPHVVVAPSPLPLGAVAQRLAWRAKRAWPACVSVLDAASLADVAHEYRATLPPRGVETRYLVHRVPGDFMHLGLVDLLFPRARVVHCQRDELDTALSCFSADSGDPARAHTATLRGIAAFTLAHRRLTAHWRAVLRAPIFEASYDRLVVDPAGEVRALKSFLGLPWHEDCLRFYESIRNRGRTGRPISSSSLGRHRHYARELAPLREMLQE